MTGILVIPGETSLSSRDSVSLSSRASAEGSVNSFYRFLHSLCSVEMTEKVPFGRNDNSCLSTPSPVGDSPTGTMRLHYSSGPKPV